MAAGAARDLLALSGGGSAEGTLVPSLSHIRFIFLALTPRRAPAPGFILSQGKPPLVHATKQGET